MFNTTFLRRPADWIKFTTLSIGILTSNSIIMTNENTNHTRNCQQKVIKFICLLMFFFFFHELCLTQLGQSWDHECLQRCISMRDTWTTWSWAFLHSLDVLIASIFYCNFRLLFRLKVFPISGMLLYFYFSV